MKPYKDYVPIKDWEYDFTNPPRIPPRSECQNCKQTTTTPLWVAKDFGRSTVQYAFCGEACANEFYLNKLRNPPVIPDWRATSLKTDEGYNG